MSKKGLSHKDRKFVAHVALTGNQTEAAQVAYGMENYGSAGVKATRLLKTAKIQQAVEETRRTLAERIPDELLEKVHLEGLAASREIVDKDGNTLTERPDHAVRHRYLDTAYKLKGSYAPEKSMNLDINVDITNQKAMELAKKYEEELKKTI